jgi:hypothetical protein
VYTPVYLDYDDKIIAHQHLPTDTTGSRETGHEIHKNSLKTCRSKTKVKTVLLLFRDTNYEKVFTSTTLLRYHLATILQPQRTTSTLLGGGRVLGDGFGTLGDGVLGEFSGKDKSDSGLDLSG